MAGCHRRQNQSSVTTTLCIPESKPDAERILRVTSSPEVKKISVIRKKVVIVCELIIHVEYVALSNCDTQPVHFASFRIPANLFVNHPHAGPCKDAKLLLEVEFQQVELVNRRTLHLFLILKAVVRKLESIQFMVRSQVSQPGDRPLAEMDGGCHCPGSCCVIDGSAFHPGGTVNCDLKC